MHQFFLKAEITSNLLKHFSKVHGLLFDIMNNHFQPLKYPLQSTQGFLTQDLFHSTSLATWGSSGASKEAKFFKELTFCGFVCYFLAKIEQSSKMSKTELKNAHLGWFLKVFSILAEKQSTKRRIVNSLKNFASFDAPLAP